MFKISHKFSRLIIISLLVILAFTIVTLPTVAQDDDNANVPLYTIQQGDTLQAIAQRFNTTVEALMRLNLITSPNYLQPGQVLIIPATGGTTPIDLSGTTRVHVVQPRENLVGIANFYNTTVEALMQANTLTNQNQLSIGQTLIIPPQGGTTVNQPTQVTTTQPTQVQVQQPVAPVVIVRQVINGRYTVQYGDTLLAISRSFGVDAWTIARANGIYNLNRIYAGQRLVIPGYGGY